MTILNDDFLGNFFTNCILLRLFCNFINPDSDNDLGIKRSHNRGLKILKNSIDYNCFTFRASQLDENCFKLTGTYLMQKVNTTYYLLS